MSSTRKMTAKRKVAKKRLTNKVARVVIALMIACPLAVASVLAVRGDPTQVILRATVLSAVLAIVVGLPATLVPLRVYGILGEVLDILGVIAYHILPPWQYDPLKSESSRSWKRPRDRR